MYKFCFICATDKNQWNSPSTEIITLNSLLFRFSYNGLCSFCFIYENILYCTSFTYTRNNLFVLASGNIFVSLQIKGDASLWDDTKDHTIFTNRKQVLNHFPSASMLLTLELHATFSTSNNKLLLHFSNLWLKQKYISTGFYFEHKQFYVFFKFRNIRICLISACCYLMTCNVIRSVIK